MTNDTIDVRSSFDWPSRLTAAVVVAIFIAAAAIWGGQPGLLVTLLCLVALLALYAASLVPRGIVHLRLSPDRVAVRRWNGWRELAASDVAEVRYLFNGRSPDFRLIGVDGTRLVVPTSTLAEGHVKLFQWLSMHAPDARLDDRSTQVRVMLESKGLVY